MIVAAILFGRIVMYQDNNLNVIKNDKDEQLIKQKVNPINGFLNEKKTLSCTTLLTI